MSIEAYFDSILESWDKFPEHNRYMKEDMKTVIRQFDTSISYDEIEKDRVQDLTDKFRKIRKEVYA